MPAATYNDFSGGVMKDPQPGILPANAVADAQDVFFDIPGQVRSRKNTQSGTSSAVTASIVAIAKTGAGDQMHGPYGVKKDTTPGRLDATSGTFTSLGSAFGSTPDWFGRPVEFFGIALFPMFTAGGHSFVPAFAAAAGTASAYSPPASTVATVTAGSNLVAFTNGDFLANASDGQFVTIQDSASSPTRNIYVGTFEPTGTHTIMVDPIPSKSFTATQGAGTGTFVVNVFSAFDTAASPNSNLAYSARSAAVHQNRVLLGNVSRWNSNTSQAEWFPRSVFYTILPDARSETPSANANAQGHAWIFRDSIESNNRFDIGGSDPILALAPIDDNELLILTSGHAWRLTGYLATRVLNDAGGVTYDVHPIPESPGVISDRSVQQTTHGLVFAALDDLYLYANSKFTPLLGRANAKYYANLLGNRVVLGSHMLNADTYVISLGTDAFVGGNGGGATITHAYHLPTKTLSRLTGNTLVCFDSVTNPVFGGSNKLGLRWWDASGSAPSMTGGSVVYTDAAIGTGGSSLTDPDGNNVAPIITTRLYDDGAPDQMKRYWRSVWRTEAASASVAIRDADNVLAGAGTSFAIGSLSGWTSFTGPVKHTMGAQYILTGTPGGGTLKLFGFDHYYDAMPFAKAS